MFKIQPLDVHTSQWVPETSNLKIALNVTLDACFVPSTCQGVRLDYSHIVVLDNFFGEDERKGLMDFLTGGCSQPHPPTIKWERETRDGTEAAPTWGLKDEVLRELAQTSLPAKLEIQSRLAKLYPEVTIAHMPSTLMQSAVHANGEPLQGPSHAPQHPDRCVNRAPFNGQDQVPQHPDLNPKDVPAPTCINPDHDQKLQGMLETEDLEEQQQLGCKGRERSPERDENVKRGKRLKVDQNANEEAGTSYAATIKVSRSKSLAQLENGSNVGTCGDHRECDGNLAGRRSNGSTTEHKSGRFVMDNDNDVPDHVSNHNATNDDGGRSLADKNCSATGSKHSQRSSSQDTRCLDQIDHRTTATHHKRKDATHNICVAQSRSLDCQGTNVRDPPVIADVIKEVERMAGSCLQEESTAVYGKSSSDPLVRADSAEGEETSSCSSDVEGPEVDCNPFVANAAMAGDVFSWHVDADPWTLPSSPWTDIHGHYMNREPGKPLLVSLLLYLDDEWRREWDAETLFLDTQSDTGVLVRPKPYRAVLLDQDVLHRLSPPSAAAGRPRYSLVWKLVMLPRDPNQRVCIARPEWGAPMALGSAALAQAAVQKLVGEMRGALR